MPPFGAFFKMTRVVGMYFGQVSRRGVAAQIPVRLVMKIMNGTGFRASTRRKVRRTWMQHTPLRRLIS